jgi:hypothetical protein
MKKIIIGLLLSQLVMVSSVQANALDRLLAHTSVKANCEPVTQCGLDPSHGGESSKDDWCKCYGKALVDGNCKATGMTVSVHDVWKKIKQVGFDIACKHSSDYGITKTVCLDDMKYSASNCKF